MSESYLSPTEYLLVDVADNILTITLNRPDALNALRPEMLQGIQSLVEQAGRDDSIAVIILKGAGRAFSAGVDLKVLQGIDPKAGKIGDVFDKPAVAAWNALRQSRCHATTLDYFRTTDRPDWSPYHKRYREYATSR